jgi:hypothetical protein
MAQALAQGRVVPVLRLVLQGRTVPAGEPADSAGGEPKAARMTSVIGRASRFGLQDFFPKTSFKTIISSVWSATSLLSLRFSSFSRRGRRASLASKPPNFCFHL